MEAQDNHGSAKVATTINWKVAWVLGRLHKSSQIALACTWRAAKRLQMAPACPGRGARRVQDVDFQLLLLCFQVSMHLALMMSIKKQDESTASKNVDFVGAFFLVL